MWEPVNVEAAIATNSSGANLEDSFQMNQYNQKQSEASHASGKGKGLTPEARDSYVTVRSVCSTLTMDFNFILLVVNIFLCCTG